jgi:hypothetical protein
MSVCFVLKYVQRFLYNSHNAESFARPPLHTESSTLNTEAIQGPTMDDSKYNNLLGVCLRF